MSGSFTDAAGPTIDADMAAIAVSAAATLARFVIRQEEAAAFVTEHGAAVNDGHTTNVIVPTFLEG